MKARHVLATITILCLILIGLWISRPTLSRVESDDLRHSVAAMPSSSMSNGSAIFGGSTAPGALVPQASVPSGGSQSPNLASNRSAPQSVNGIGNPSLRPDQKAKAWFAQQNGKINFWGRVVDQDDQPLQDVRVVMKVRRWRAVPAGAEFPEFVTTTDLNGRFQFLDVSGDTMSIASLTKHGYRLSMEDQRRSMAYQYHNLSVTFVPDQSNPEVFHLYKEKGAEPMVYLEIRGPIPVDGTPSEFELNRGKIVASGGDLQIRMVRDPIEINRSLRKNYYGWRIRIAIRGGGIQERKDHFGFEAPGGGYSDSLEFGQAASDPNWTRRWEGEFYFRTSNGLYGRIKASVNTDYQPPPCGLFAYCYLNPSGSRNLEYDSMKRIMPR